MSSPTFRKGIGVIRLRGIFALCAKMLSAPDDRVLTLQIAKGSAQGDKGWMRARSDIATDFQSMRVRSRDSAIIIKVIISNPRDAMRMPTALLGRMEKRP